MLAGLVGRFYGDGFAWAFALPLPRLMRLAAIMREIERREHVG